MSRLVRGLSAGTLETGGFEWSCRTWDFFQSVPIEGSHLRTFEPSTKPGSEIKMSRIFTETIIFFESKIGLNVAVSVVRHNAT